MQIKVRNYTLLASKSGPGEDIIFEHLYTENINIFYSKSVLVSQGKSLLLELNRSIDKYDGVHLTDTILKEMEITLQSIFNKYNEHGMISDIAPSYHHCQSMWLISRTPFFEIY